MKILNEILGNTKTHKKMQIKKRKKFLLEEESFYSLLF